MLDLSTETVSNIIFGGVSFFSLEIITAIITLITGKSRHFTCFGVLYPDTLLALLGSDLIFLRCYAELILLFG